MKDNPCGLEGRVAVVTGGGRGIGKAICASLIQMALETFGKIDILVNNAGIMCRTRLMDISLDEWERTLQINLTGAFLCTKAVLPTMRESEFGRIVNISSSAGRNVSTLGWARPKKSDTLLFFCVRTKPHTLPGPPWISTAETS